MRTPLFMCHECSAETNCHAADELRIDGNDGLVCEYCWDRCIDNQGVEWDTLPEFVQPEVIACRMLIDWAEAGDAPQMLDEAVEQARKALGVKA